MISEFSICLAVPCVLSFLIVPLVRRFAFHIGALDKPDERKIHKQPIPRLGGVAVFLSFFLSFFILLFLFPHREDLQWLVGTPGVLLGTSLLLMVALGIWDDLHPLKPGGKFLVQIVAGTLVYLAGFGIATVTNPLAGGQLSLGFLSYPATVLWVVGVTNAFNLIDGLDGLASGIALISASTICAISLLQHEVGAALLCLLLAGAILGFLPYNFNPAKIFLGDSGSLFLGFALSVLSIQSSTKGTTAFSLLVPVFALGLPIMDTLLSMARRFFGSFLPGSMDLETLGGKLRCMFLPDKRHVHHQLLASGLSHRDTVLVLYGVALTFGLAAFALTASEINALLVLALMAVVMIVGIRKLGYREMALLRNGILLPLYERPLLQRRLFIITLDLFFAFIAYLAAHSLVFASPMGALTSKEFVITLILLISIQLGSFAYGGLYKGNFIIAGLGDFLQVVKSVTVAALLGGVFLALLPLVDTQAHLPMLVVLDFYFLLSLVSGSRISFHVLNYLFRRDFNGGTRVLIYGANAGGLLMLQNFLTNHHPEYVPAGFLDDDPSLEGKSLNGYPILGGHWKLERLVKKLGIKEIIFSTPIVRPEVFRRMLLVAQMNGVELKKSTISLEEILTDRVAVAKKKAALADISR